MNEVKLASRAAHEYGPSEFENGLSGKEPSSFGTSSRRVKRGTTRRGLILTVNSGLSATVDIGRRQSPRPTRLLRGAPWRWATARRLVAEMPWKHSGSFTSVDACAHID